MTLLTTYLVIWMYKIIFDKEASKYIRKLDASTRLRIRDALLELADNPYSDSNVKRLKGQSGLFRKRVGDYRIIFCITDQGVIMILKIASRGEVYKK